MSTTKTPYRLIGDLQHDVGEGPTWDETTGQLFWTSINDGQIHALTMATGEKEVWSFEGPVGSFGLCRSGRLVVALRNEVVLFDPRTKATTALASVMHAVPEMRFNDGKVGPDGAFWVGSMDERAEKEPVGKLYRIDASGRVDVLTDGIKVANGLAWDSAGTAMYFADTRGIWIDRWRFDPATGAATGRERFVVPDEASMGRPDGAACDIDGNYWSAAPSASRINRFSPEGRLLDWIDVPNYRPTMPCFGGPEMRTMFITSLRTGLTPEQRAEHPLCGATIAVETSATGLPALRFAD